MLPSTILSARISAYTLLMGIFLANTPFICHLKLVNGNDERNTVILKNGSQ